MKFEVEKSKVLKLTVSEHFLELKQKKSTWLWHEAHFKVKMAIAPHER